MSRQSYQITSPLSQPFSEVLRPEYEIVKVKIKIFERVIGRNSQRPSTIKPHPLPFKLGQGLPVILAARVSNVQGHCWTYGLDCFFLSHAALFRDHCSQSLVKMISSNRTYSLNNDYPLAWHSYRKHLAWLVLCSGSVRWAWAWCDPSCGTMHVGTSCCTLIGSSGPLIVGSSTNAASSLTIPLPLPRKQTNKHVTNCNHIHISV